MRFLYNLRNSRISLASLLAVQLFCAVFFLGEGMLESFDLDLDATGISHDVFESVLAVALLGSLLLTVIEFRSLQEREEHMKSKLKAATGAFAQLLDEHFEQWSLTPSERDVALLAVKGLSISDIARVRATKEGTIKAQCNAIYRKAGVTGRTQLLSIFIEELLAEELVSTEQLQHSDQ